MKNVHEQNFDNEAKKRRRISLVCRVGAMKKWIIHSLLVVLTFLMASPAVADADLEKKVEAMAKELSDDIAAVDKNRVAVYGIESADKQSTPFSRFMAEKLTNALIRTSDNRFHIIERYLIDQIKGDRIDLTAEELHNLLSADVLISGTYMIVGDDVDVSIRAIDLLTANALGAAGTTIPVDSVGALISTREREQSQEKKGTSDDLAMGVEIIGYQYENNSEKRFRIQNGDILHSGDQFSVNIKTNQDGYLYVFLYDSRGKAGVLFPNPQIALDNAVRGGVLYSLPGGNLRFNLDDNPGTETLYFAASLEPMNDIAQLLTESAETAGNDNGENLDTRLRRALLTRGVGIAPMMEGAHPSIRPSSEISVENRMQLMEMIKGRQSVLKVVELLHLPRN